MFTFSELLKMKLLYMYMYNQYIAIFIMFIDSDSRTVLITVSAYFNVE